MKDSTRNHVIVLAKKITALRSTRALLQIMIDFEVVYSESTSFTMVKVKHHCISNKYCEATSHFVSEDII